MIDEGLQRASAVGLDAFNDVWPRSFSLDELRRLLGPQADELIREALDRHVSAPLWTLVDRGGKRWRTAIGRLAYRVARGAEPAPEAVFEVPELLHNASLVVDDIEDAAVERRGGAPAHLTHGVPIALNAANAAYFRALAVLRGVLSDGPRLRALDMLAEELFVAHLGQALDLTLGASLKLGRELRPAHYEMLARAKTGALVRIAARLGAIAAAGSVEVERTLAGWAGDLGIAYQIRDDVDDLAQGSSDLERGRLTYPLLAFLEQEGDAGRRLVERALAYGSSSVGPELATQLASATVVGRCRTAASAAAARATAALAALPEDPARDALMALTQRLAAGTADEP